MLTESKQIIYYRRSWTGGFDSSVSLRGRVSRESQTRTSPTATEQLLIQGLVRRMQESSSTGLCYAPCVAGNFCLQDIVFIGAARPTASPKTYIILEDWTRTQ